MAGPWEAYQQGTQKGPWEAYGGGASQQPESEGAGFNPQAALDTVVDTAKNIGSGALSGAANIGATLAAPVDLLIGGVPAVKDRREKLRSFFMENADTGSNAFRLGELGSEIAGTAGVGGAISKVLGGAGRALLPNSRFIPKLASAVESGGFKLGTPSAGTVGERLLDLGTRAAGGAVAGGAAAGLINPENAATGAVIGGALPVGVLGAGATGRGLRNAITGGQVSPEVQSLYAKAQQYGIDIPADRIANSRPLNAAAASLEYMPFSGRTASLDAMRKQFDTALSRTVGQNTSNVAEALRRAETQLGAAFEQTLTQNGVKYDNALLRKLVDNLDEARLELGANSKEYARLVDITNDMFDRAKQTAGGALEMDGQAAYHIKKVLDRIGDSADTSLAYHARQMKTSLMDALDRSLGPQKAAEFAKVRQQYGNMLTLQGMVPHGAEGSVSPARLAAAKGLRGELSDLADIAGQFLKTRESPHGAMQRVVLGAGAGGFALGSPAAIPYIALGAAAGRTGNAALNSPIVKDLLLRQPTATSYDALASPAGRTLIYDLLSQGSQAGQR